MRKLMITLSTAATILSACSGNVQKQEEKVSDNFTYQVEKFADLQILQQSGNGFADYALYGRILLGRDGGYVACANAKRAQGNV